MAYTPFLGKTSIISSIPSSVLAGASVIGLTPVTLGATRPSISGTVEIATDPVNVDATGQGDVPITLDSEEVTILQKAGSVLATSATVSVEKVSIIGITPSSMLVGASIYGLAPVTLGATRPSISGTIIANQGTWSGSTVALILSKPSISGAVDVANTVTVDATSSGDVPVTLDSEQIDVNIAADGAGGVEVLQDTAGDLNVAASIIGTVPVTGSFAVEAASVIQQGDWIVSVVSTVPSSMIVGASVFGLAPVTLGATRPSISGTVNIGGTPNVNTAGSVVAFQGAGWSGSVAALITNTSVNVSGSVVATQGTNPWVIGSVVGTYAEDAAHGTGNKGMFALGVRNDTLASVTSADKDYSQITVGPVGEQITTIAPFTKGIQGTGDLRTSSGASVVVIAAQGVSVFSYLRSAQLANMGSASVLVTFGGGLGSILGYSIAPAGGGSNIKFDPWLKTGANSAFTASISGVASVLVSAQGFVAKE